MSTIDCLPNPFSSYYMVHTTNHQHICHARCCCKGCQMKRLFACLRIASVNLLKKDPSPWAIAEGEGGDGGAGIAGTRCLEDREVLPEPVVLLPPCRAVHQGWQDQRADSDIINRSQHFIYTAYQPTDIQHLHCCIADQNNFCNLC
jgi:hypothetical protein